jgi:hypothetical protein
MFQFSRFASISGFPAHAGRVSPFGNPRIKPPCGSPWLIAAWHVLLRLMEPRHPPYALIHLLLTYGSLLLKSICRSGPVKTGPLAFSAQHVKELYPGFPGNVKDNAYLPYTGIPNVVLPTEVRYSSQLCQLEEVLFEPLLMVVDYACPSQAGIQNIAPRPKSDTPASCAN